MAITHKEPHPPAGLEPATSRLSVEVTHTYNAFRLYESDKGECGYAVSGACGFEPRNLIEVKFFILEVTAFYNADSVVRIG